jgi:hypothetical protein
VGRKYSSWCDRQRVLQVPSKYDNLPQLMGRATLEMNYTLKGDAIGGEVTRTSIMVLDGYNAPVSAGCFMDLVQKQWYDKMQIQRADGFVVQTGKPEGKGQGYIDPVTKKMRTCASCFSVSWYCATPQ